jgi:hypothetical protein
MELHIKNFEYGEAEMIEFEPAYVQEFNLYLELKDLLTYSLCGIDLHSKGRRAENSILIRFAIATLEKFLSKQNDALLSMLVKVKEELEGQSSSVRENLLKFLEKVLLVLKNEKPLQKNEYDEMFNSLKVLLDKLTSINRDVEEKMLARYRYRKHYQI